MDEVSVVVTGHRGFGAYPKSAVCPILISKYLSELPPIPVPVDAEGPVCHQFFIDDVIKQHTFWFARVCVCVWERGVWGVRACAHERAQDIDINGGRRAGWNNASVSTHTYTHTHTTSVSLSSHYEYTDEIVVYILTNLHKADWKVWISSTACASVPFSAPLFHHLLVPDACMCAWCVCVCACVVCVCVHARACQEHRNKE